VKQKPLLELAAKAAGLSVYYLPNGDLAFTDTNEDFDPINCEYNAFVVQNAAGIEILYPTGCVVAQGVDRLGNLIAEQIEYDQEIVHPYYKSDRLRACRLAITKVAARIGQSMITNFSERKLIADWVRDMCQGLDANAIADGIENGGNDAIDNFKVTK
jgi:hypothetical protein